MTTPENLNDESYAKWKAIVENKPRYVAFVDGDPVDTGNNFTTVAINASELRSQRGEEALLSIYDTQQ